MEVNNGTPSTKVDIVKFDRREKVKRRLSFESDKSVVVEKVKKGLLECTEIMEPLQLALNDEELVVLAELAEAKKENEEPKTEEEEIKFKVDKEFREQLYPKKLYHAGWTTIRWPKQAKLVRYMDWKTGKIKTEINQYHIGQEIAWDLYNAAPLPTVKVAGRDEEKIRQLIYGWFDNEEKHLSDYQDMVSSDVQRLPPGMCLIQWAEIGRMCFCLDCAGEGHDGIYCEMLRWRSEYSSERAFKAFKYCEKCGYLCSPWAEKAK